MKSEAIRVGDRSMVAAVRRAARAHAESLGWRESERGDCEIVASELATNLVKHARDGVVVIMSGGQGADGIVQLVAVDKGPGISDVSRCLEDGYSTAGSYGTGLGAIARLSRDTDIVSGPDGTVVVVVLPRRSAAGEREERTHANAVLEGFRLGVVDLEKEGQIVNGDGWAARQVIDGLALLVTDGLGHGEPAHAASRRAIDAFREAPWSGPKDALAAVDAALRSTRGAAGAVALIDRARSVVRFCGIGNIAACLVTDERARHLVSLNGILGHVVRRITEFEYPWSDDATLVLHSDGISARWQASRWPGLWHRCPATIAAVLYRDCARGTDDLVAVAVRR